MSTEDWAFVLVLIVMGIAAVVCGIAWKVAYDDGREAGALHERNTRNEGRLTARRLDRATGEIWGTEPGPDKFDNWLRDLSGDNERLASTGELRQLERKPPTATGSFRSVLATKADAFIARMQMEEAAFRKDLTS